MERSVEVDRYLAAVPADRRAALERLRELCRQALDGYQETLEYRMPSYRRPGSGIEVAFASQARYISLYIMRKAVLDRYRDRLADASLGKGCVRYSSPEKIDFDLAREMLEASARDAGKIC